MTETISKTYRVHFVVFTTLSGYLDVEGVASAADAAYVADPAGVVTWTEDAISEAEVAEVEELSIATISTRLAS